MKITDTIKYVGVNDHQVDLFEGQYAVPNGMAYNSYVILDDKVAVMDTVDANFKHEWLDNLEQALGGRKPDYLIVQHMEPDHAANVANFLEVYPGTTVVANAKTFVMIKNFFGLDLEGQKLEVENGSTLSSGFSQETAAKMVNSALVLKGEEGMFSTVDICAVDLYTGICNFLKAGAASTFIKRDHWVESITSESLAAGLVQQIDFDTASRKLYHGDYLIMMTDGVLDALPDQKEEETMKEIIMDVHEESPKDFGRGILERVLGYSDYHARDDMTVLVCGLYRKPENYSGA